MDKSTGFGIYVHWPWCQTICPYCDFNRYAAQSVDQAEWARAYCRQIETSAREIGGGTCQSIYFGGGTPSLMEPSTVAAVIERIGDFWNVESGAEVTIEANPTSVETERFGRYSEAGVNRISIGVQSLRDADLVMLGRKHTAAEARAAYDVARNHFGNVSIDLIYARQHQTLEAWSSELEEALKWEPHHLSLYQLSIETGTGFGRLQSQGRLPGLPDEDLAADMMITAHERCARAGYKGYEVSNFARECRESQHNLLYWRYADYLGIGPGAHSRLTIGGSKYAVETIARPAAWIDAVFTNGNGESGRSRLGREDQAGEYLMASLRLDEGMQYSHYIALGGRELGRETVEELVVEGWLETEPDRIRVTARGRLLLNTVIMQLLDSATSH